MDTSNQLVNLIREIVKDELLNKDDATICLVQSVNADGTLNIKLLSDIDTIIENIPNNSAYTFESGDYAVLYKLDNNLANAFVMSKVTDVPPELVKNTYIIGGGSSSSSGAPMPSNVNNGKLTIQKNGTQVATFTANQADDVVANILVPTKTSDLTNDGGIMPSTGDPYTTKSFVNSSIATNTAYFCGTYNIVTDLGLTTSATEQEIATALATKMQQESITPTNNDYCFVSYPDATDPTQYDKYDRYKYDGDTSTWLYEYTLNNSSFTAAQWAAINSGVASGNWVTTNTTQTISGEKTFTEDVKINGKTIIFTGDCKLKSSNAIYRFGDSSDPSGVMVAANASGVRFLRPGQNNIMDLGTTAVKWKNLYLSSTAYIPTINNGSNISVPTTSGTLALTSDIPDMTNVAYKNIDNNFSDKETFTGGIKVTGRYVGGGDDEGIIVGTATNGYAGVCCGSPSGRRAVFYLKPSATSGNSVWRYNNGSASYDIAHPEKSGTIALISDVNGDVPATASSVAQRDSSANLNATSFSMCTSGTSNSNAKMQYNSTNESIEFIFG